ncbi:MAG: YlbL family protein [Propionibacteriaceae bacterium]
MTNQPRSPRSHRLTLTAQTWQALSAGIAFLCLAILISFLPTPYLIWSPGNATNLNQEQTATGEPKTIDLGQVNAAGTTLNGKLFLLTVAQSRTDSLVSLPEAILADVFPKRDAMPRSVLVPPGKTEAEIQHEDQIAMDSSQDAALVAGLVTAGVNVTQRVQVTKIVTTGPSHGKLELGDFLLQVDGLPVLLPTDVASIISSIKKRVPGSTINLQVLRAGQKVSVDVTLAASNEDKAIPTLGIGISTGYDYATTKAKIAIDPAIGGPSGGLAFALGVYDLVATEDLLRGRSVAATGEISADGVVSPIGGVQEKIGAAEQAAASIMFIPTANCVDVARIATDIRIIPVNSLLDAISALQALGTEDEATRVPSCS